MGVENARAAERENKNGPPHTEFNRCVFPSAWHGLVRSLFSLSLSLVIEDKTSSVCMLVRLTLLTLCVCVKILN